MIDGTAKATATAAAMIMMMYEYHQFEDKPKLSSLKVEYHHLIGRSHHPIQLESQA